MFNTIILLKGIETLTKKQFKTFEKGNTIFGLDSEPEELKRWSISNKDEAEKALSELKCVYRLLPESVDITEYALEYCECDENGEFVQGSDFDLATDI